MRQWLQPCTMRRRIPKDLFVMGLIGLAILCSTPHLHQKLIQATAHFDGDQHHADVGDRHVVYIMLGCGLGCAVMNAAAAAIYFSDRQQRSVIIDSSMYNKYRRNRTQGVLLGYFTPQFPVIDSPDDFGMVDQRASAGQMTYQVEQQKVIRNRDFDVSFNKELIVIRGVTSVRRPIELYYNIWLASRLTWLPAWLTGSYRFYDKMVSFMCPHFQFNDLTVSEIAQYKTEHNIPLIVNGTSVAWHIRRGDKIYHDNFHVTSSGLLGKFRGIILWTYSRFAPMGESRLFSADSYVEKFMNVAPRGTSVDHCFIASDDYSAVEEMHASLARHGFRCKIHTLTLPAQRGHRMPESEVVEGETIHFLAEISMMIDATYFVGAFNSNVASLVSVLRGCNSTDRTHFSRSWGVDRDAFYLV
jgi:hypothetical protein